MIIFDCDGVILDSNRFKINAFELLVEPLCSLEEKKIFLEYIRIHFGKSRFHFIEYLLRNILETYSIDLYESLLSNYSEMCLSLYKECSMTEGALNFLSNNNQLKFIASGSSQEELRGVFEHKNIAKYFESIYGSPKTKRDIVVEIMSGLSGKEKVVMVGDSKSDMNACKDIPNITFVYMSDYSLQKEEFIDFQGLKIKNLTELGAVLVKYL